MAPVFRLAVTVCRRNRYSSDDSKNITVRNFGRMTLGPAMQQALSYQRRGFLCSPNSSFNFDVLPVR